MLKSANSDVSDRAVAEVHSGQAPRSSTLLSKTLLVTGYVGTFLASLVTAEMVSTLTKENALAHEARANSGLVGAFQKGLKQSVDLRLWKSGIAQVATLLAGFLLTDLAVKKIEQGTFKRQHEPLPSVNPADQAPEVEGSVAGVGNKWQDKEIQKRVVDSKAISINS